MARTLPLGALRPADVARFSASIAYHPGLNLSPRLWFRFRLPLAPLAEGEQPELTLGAIELPIRQVDKISGHFGAVEEFGESSLFLRGTHNPVTIRGFSLRHLGEYRFDAEFELALGLESEGSGYLDAGLTLGFEAVWEGVLWRYPRWTAPAPHLPAEWGIPPRWEFSSALTFVERFLDTSGCVAHEEPWGLRLTPGALGK